jgi:hypothetical protein
VLLVAAQPFAHSGASTQMRPGPVWERRRFARYSLASKLKGWQQASAAPSGNGDPQITRSALILARSASALPTKPTPPPPNFSKLREGSAPCEAQFRLFS